MTSRANEASATTLADLARAGYSVSRQSFMQVNFEVHHLVDREGYLHALLSSALAARRGDPAAPATGLGADGAAQEPSGATKEAAGAASDGAAKEGTAEPDRGTYLPRETVSSAANGVGLVVATYAGSLPPEIRSRRQGSGLPVALKVDDREDARVFRGTAWPNPTFIYESARAFEGIILLDDKAWSPSCMHGLAIGETLEFVSNLAKEKEAPLLLLHSPVQIPVARTEDEDVSTRGESKPGSSSIAVRFSIALRRPSAELRMELAGKVSRFCKERGFGLWVADIRVGHKSGNWFDVQTYNRTRAIQCMEENNAGTAAIELTHCLPITLVGPARVGSTHAVMRFLRQYPQLGVLGCSVSSLDDLAFIHLQLAINKIPAGGTAELGRTLDEAIRSVASTPSDGPTTSGPEELLPAVLPLLTGNSKPAIAPEVRAGLIDRAGNYQALAGPPLPLRQAPAGDRVALWFSWQAAGDDAGLAAPLIAFVDAVRDHLQTSTVGSTPETATDPTIEYVICRDLGDSVLRGMGKVSVPSGVLSVRGPATLESAGARLSTSLEDGWRAELERYGLPGIVELAVARQEYRLDHSTS